MILRNFRESLTCKYLGITSGFVLVIQVFFGLGFTQWISRSQLRLLEQKARDEAVFLSGVTPEAILDADFLSLERLMRQTAIDEHIIYSVVLDANGLPLTRYLDSDRPSDDPVWALLQETEVDTKNILQWLDRLKDQPQIYEISEPIVSAGATIGEIKLGYSTHLIQRQVTTMRLLIFLISVLVSLLLASLNYLLFHRFVRSPIQELNYFASALSEGNLKTRMPEFHIDELGRLTRAFNKMADQLQEILEDITQARDQALAGTKAKSDFLATMSHEIRTPLNAILGMTNLLMDTQLNREQYQFANTIRHSGENLLAIINEILDFSKIEANRLELEIQAFDLYRCIHETMSISGVEANRKELKLIHTIDVNTPRYVRGDITRLRQVLLNLLSNAIKFTELGSVTLMCKHHEEDGQSFLSISVKDTGIGIEPEKQQYIFEAFTQEDTSVTRRYGGTGLGLVICQRICELMGGHISLVSEKGLGSKFTVTLPIESATTGEIQHLESVVGKTKVYMSDGIDKIQHAHIPLKILLAEDIQVNCQVATLFLSRLGYRLDTVGNGKEVLEALERQDYDVIFMDWHMPEMDGLTATRMIRQKWKEPTKPWIVAMTANAFAEQKATCLKVGMNDFIAKPVQLRDVAQALLRVPRVVKEMENRPAIAPPQPPSHNAPEPPEESDTMKGMNLPLDFDTSDPIDGEAWNDLLAMADDGDYGIIEEMIRTYLDDSPKQLMHIADAIAQQSAKDLRFAAHSLKGASLYLGAKELSEQCFSLEKLAKEDGPHLWEESQQRLPNLQATYKETATALEKRHDLLAQMSQQS